jgi:hypothetical protein
MKRCHVHRQQGGPCRNVLHEAVPLANEIAQMAAVAVQLAKEAINRII